MYQFVSMFVEERKKSLKFFCRLSFLYFLFIYYGINMSVIPGNTSCNSFKVITKLTHCPFITSMESPFFFPNVHPIRKVRWIPLKDDQHTVGFITANQLNLVRYEPSANTFLDLDCSKLFNGLLTDLVILKPQSMNNKKSRNHSHHHQYGLYGTIENSEDPLMIVSDSHGCIHYLKIQQDANYNSKTELKVLASYKLHSTSNSGCQGLSVCSFNSHLASYDKHGHIVVSEHHQGKVQYSTSEPVDVLPVSAMVWQTSSTILASTQAGNVANIDIREKKSNILKYKNDLGVRYPFTSLASHPSLNYYFATGSISGDIALWDLRNTANPLNHTSNVHEGSVTDLTFDPNSPNNLLNCSEDGMISAFDWTRLQKDVYQRNMKLYRNPLHNLGWNCIEMNEHIEGLVLVAGDQSDLIVLETNQL